MILLSPSICFTDAIARVCGQIPSKSQSKFQTAVVDDSLNPIWNHEEDVVGFSMKDADPLEFSLYRSVHETVASANKQPVIPTHISMLRVSSSVLDD